MHSCTCAICYYSHLYFLKFSLHLDLVTKCLAKYNKDQFDVEQTLSTGCDSAGMPITDSLTLLNPFIFGRRTA